MVIRLPISGHISRYLALDIYCDTSLPVRSVQEGERVGRNAALTLEMENCNRLLRKDERHGDNL